MLSVTFEKVLRITFFSLAGVFCCTLVELTVDDEMLISLCLLDYVIPDFCNSNVTQESDRFELALTITHVLQANQLTKYASYPKDNFFTENLRTTASAADEILLYSYCFLLHLVLI